MFKPNPNAIQAELDKLNARQPGGFYHTPEDKRWIVSTTKHKYLPGSNLFIFWEAVEKELSK